MKDFRSLKVWEKSHALTLAIYKSTDAMGSSSELEYLLLLARDFGYIQAGIYQSMQNEIVETRKMLNAFIQKLKASR